MKSAGARGQSAMEFLSAVFVATLLLAWTLGKLPLPSMKSADQAIQHVEAAVQPIGRAWAQSKGGELERFGRHAIVTVPGEFATVRRLSQVQFHSEALAKINLPIKTSVSGGICSILFSCQPQELLRQSQDAIGKLKTFVGM